MYAGWLLSDVHKDFLILVQYCTATKYLSVNKTASILAGKNMCYLGNFGPSYLIAAAVKKQNRRIPVFVNTVMLLQGW